MRVSLSTSSARPACLVSQSDYRTTRPEWWCCRQTSEIKFYCKKRGKGEKRISLWYHERLDLFIFEPGDKLRIKQRIIEFRCLLTLLMIFVCLNSRKKVGENQVWITEVSMPCLFTVKSWSTRTKTVAIKKKVENLNPFEWLYTREVWIVINYYDMLLLHQYGLSSKGDSLTNNLPEYISNCWVLVNYEIRRLLPVFNYSQETATGASIKDQKSNIEDVVYTKPVRRIPESVDRKSVV